MIFNSDHWLIVAVWSNGRRNIYPHPYRTWDEGNAAAQELQPSMPPGLKLQVEFFSNVEKYDEYKVVIGQTPGKQEYGFVITARDEKTHVVDEFVWPQKFSSPYECQQAAEKYAGDLVKSGLFIGWKKD